ncbi:hypothetical protein AB5I41_22910 [Sphingomonas sp. MMS24-JH45]
MASGVTRITTLTYASGSTTVTDAGQATTLRYENARRHARLDHRPAGQRRRGGADDRLHLQYARRRRERDRRSGERDPLHLRQPRQRAD